jgi:hypothetical protein
VSTRHVVESRTMLCLLSIRTANVYVNNTGVPRPTVGVLRLGFQA